MKKLLPEFLGTYIIVFCGTGSIIINSISGGIITHVGIAVTFGLVVMAMIYTFPSAQFNPAVSIGLMINKQLEKGEALGNILIQFAGALSASLTLKLLFPDSSTLGATIPSGSQLQSFFLEILLMFFLVLAAIKSGEKTPHLVGAVVGAIVLLEALFAGPISGASMNPARSFAPALLSSNLNTVWIYLSAPVLGSLLAFWVAKKA